nr:PREDICTED: apoptotic chromatin condensation inducer in the nucleus [Bemisia tabaci]XP_018897583.1 PREDICTED: apoptotic chromatin condensation inducer in the nucleus [Bemisia tabaci]
MRRKSERKPKETKASPEKPRRSNRSSRRRKKSSSSEAESDVAEVESSDEEVPVAKKGRSRLSNTESESEKPQDSGRPTRQRRGQAAVQEDKTDSSFVEEEVVEETEPKTQKSEVETSEEKIAASVESTNGTELSNEVDQPEGNQGRSESVESSPSPIRKKRRDTVEDQKPSADEEMNENGNDSSIKDSKISEADDDDVVQINAEPVEDLESTQDKISNLGRSESPELNYSPDRTDARKSGGVDSQRGDNTRCDSDSENSDGESGARKSMQSSVRQVDTSQKQRSKDDPSAGVEKGVAAQEGHKDGSGKREEKDEDDIVELKDLTQDDDIQEIGEVVLKTSAAPLPRDQRKRRWGTCRAAKVETPVVISSDYLKTIIPDVKPIAEDELNFSDEKLTGDEEEEGEIKTPREASDDELICDQTVILDEEKPTDKKDKDKTERKKSEKHDKDAKSSDKKRDSKELSKASPAEVNNKGKQVVRKISIVSEEAKKLARPPTPSKNVPSSVLLITNLVRPFTIIQLRELLQRTGKIQEGGFWIDAIKSKCIVEFENEDQAVETRHALHDVRWPVSNPKLLHVDFCKKEDLIKAQASTADSARKMENILADPYAIKKAKGNAPVREWDVGKPSFPDEILSNERSKGGLRGFDDIKVERDRERERKDRIRDRDRDRDIDRERERDLERDRDRKNRKDKNRRSRSPGSLEPPVRRQRRKDDEAPAKLLDDLFCKTKTLPCIYWLPLSNEQIAMKEEQRRLHLAEFNKRMSGKSSDKDKFDRDRGKESTRDRDRDSRRKDRSRDRDRK